MLRRWFSRQVTLRVEPDMLHDEEFWADVELPPKRVRARWKLWLEFAAFVVGGAAVAACSLLVGARVDWELSRPLIEGRDVPAWPSVVMLVLIGVGIIAIGAFGLVRALSYRKVAVAEEAARAQEREQPSGRDAAPAA